MKSISKAFFVTLFVFLVGSFPPPVPAQFGGGVVVCVNCSEKATQAVQLARQILQYAKQLEQYAKQVEQYANQVERLKDQLKNSVKITSPIFDSALSTIRSIENTMASARNISYTWGNLDTSFRIQFRDVYQEYDRINNFTDSWEALQTEFDRSERTYDSALSALKAARAQSISLQDDQYRMDVAGWHLIGADGRLDAIQAAGEYAQMSAQQLMKMRHLAMVQLQLMSQVQADEEQRRISEAAATKVFTDRKPTPAFPNGFTPN